MNQVEKAEKLLSQEEKDAVSYYRWAIKHHMELAKSFQERLIEITQEEDEQHI